MITFLILAAIIAVCVYFFLQTAPFGKNPEGARLEKIRNSPNFKDGVFKNLTPTEVMAEDASYFKMMKEFFSEGTEREPKQPIPSVKRDLTEAPSNAPQITWFGHSTYLIQVNGKNILVDPVFSERTSPVQFVGTKSFPGALVYQIKDFPAIDLVVLTHDHYDHLDYNSILELKEKAGHFIMPLGVGSHLESWGIPAEKITELDWWDTTSFAKDFKFTAAPARHFSGRGLTRNKTLWASYILEFPGHKIYLGGDSGYDKFFKEIGDKYGPFDLVMLESGQYNVKWPNIHMMPEQTVQAATDLKAKVLLPVHWGKYRLAVHPWKEPIERVLKKAETSNFKITTPLIGEKIILDSLYPDKKWWR